MAFCLSGKLVALHSDNSTTKAYLCNQGGTVSVAHSRLACSTLNLANKHGITLFPAYTYPCQWVRQLSVMGKIGSTVASSSSHSLGRISTFGSTRGGSAGILTHKSISALLHLAESTTSGSLGVEHF